MRFGLEKKHSGVRFSGMKETRRNSHPGPWLDSGDKQKAEKRLEQEGGCRDEQERRTVLAGLSPLLPPWRQEAVTLFTRRNHTAEQCF